MRNLLLAVSHRVVEVSASVPRDSANLVEDFRAIVILADDSASEEIVDAATEVCEEAVQRVVPLHDRQALDRGKLD